MMARQPESPRVMFWHFHDAPRWAQHKAEIGFSTFETDGFLPQEAEVISKLDAIGTASKWGAAVLETRFPGKKVFRAPHAFQVEEGGHTPRLQEREILEPWKKIFGVDFPEDTLVLSMGGKYESRKGHPEVIDALSVIKEPTLVVMFCHNWFIQPSGYDLSQLIYHTFERVYTEPNVMLYNKGPAWVAMMPRTNTHEELHGALSRAHTFFAPSKGEGWNLPLFEMMSYGMHCAATLNTAHLDYCDETNVTVIQQGDLTTAYDGRFMQGNRGQWYDVRQEHVAHAIEECRRLHFDEPTKVKKLQQAAWESTQKFSWQESARSLLESCPVSPA